MKSSASRFVVFQVLATFAAVGMSMPAFAAPDPCKLITVAEMEQIVGPLKGAPVGTDPASGEISCNFEPAKGYSFIDVSLHQGDLAVERKSSLHKSAVSLPEFGKDAFVDPNFQEYADLWAKKGNLILRITLPMGPKSVDTAKAIASKALPRL